MTHGDLFSEIGMFSLAAQRTGIGNSIVPDIAEALFETIQGLEAWLNNEDI